MPPIKAMDAREKAGELIEWDEASERVNPYHDAPYSNWFDFETGFHDAMEAHAVIHARLRETQEVADMIRRLAR